MKLRMQGEGFRSPEFAIRLTGRYALFTDPITRTGGEKYSYPVPTYGALKGAVRAIYWKPTLNWYIDEVRVMKQVQTVTRGMRVPDRTATSVQLSCYMYLFDVEYQVKCHYEWDLTQSRMEKDRSPVKHTECFRRALQIGGRRPIFLGTSECVCDVEPCEYGEGEGYYDHRNKDLGVMFHSFSYPGDELNPLYPDRITVNMDLMKMENGIIRFRRPEECGIRRPSTRLLPYMFPDWKGEAEER